FRNLSDDQLAQILPLIEPCRHTKGTFFFEQGDPACNLYVVVSGEVEIRYKTYDGPTITVARVGPGGIFGWSAALGRETYTSSAACTEDCQVFCIDGCSLRRMCDENPDTGVILMERLAGAIAERETYKHSQVMTMLTQNSDLSENCSRRAQRDG
ncbi:MAG TPA: cyclic nucleotide-binding domain-containing protein, partial [Candidatus Methylomirabilis sp.]|nr:cyclic nucleotide-binding domain-containing protein [Candidatus Methylomirabilis sp.]